MTKSNKNTNRNQSPSPRRAKTTYQKKKNKVNSIPIKKSISLEDDDNAASTIQWYNEFTKGDETYNAYMANEWGYEKHGDQVLFEKLCLEGAQSGLSWRTILNKREAYRKAFHGFNIERVVKMTSSDIDQLLHSNKTGNDMIVKHRGKVDSVIHNAKRVQELLPVIQKEGYKDFSDWLWSFVDHKPILNHWKRLSEMPSKTDESIAMSKALKKNGFKFVGPTTCYSLMQSCGFVIDHPANTKEWNAALDRLQKRKGGFQDRR